MMGNVGMGHPITDGFARRYGPESDPGTKRPVVFTARRSALAGSPGRMAPSCASARVCSGPWAPGDPSMGTSASRVFTPRAARQCSTSMPAALCWDVHEAEREDGACRHPGRNRIDISSCSGRDRSYHERRATRPPRRWRPLLHGWLVATRASDACARIRFTSRATSVPCGMTSPAWHRFEVDGETYYWRTYPSEWRTGQGPWVGVESLEVSRQPDTPGVARSHPAGTTVTEEHAVELVRLFREGGRSIP